MGDLFDIVETLEENLRLNGEEQGKHEAELKHFKEGFTYGWQQSCHIQSELGLIKGFLSAVLSNSSSLSAREKNIIQKIISVINKCNEWNPEDETELERNLNLVHTKAKFILNKLNIEHTIMNKEVDSEF